jgi:uncharacterized protein (DUF2267 family)
MTAASFTARAGELLHVWMKELREKAGFDDEEQALRIFRIVLHELRDRLTVEEAADLAAQLPVLIRGIYYEGWRPSTMPHKIHNKQKFVDEITVKLLPDAEPAEPAVRSVFALLAHHCDPGEIADVIAQLPGDLKALWPESARTFRERTRAGG